MRRRWVGAALAMIPAPARAVTGAWGTSEHVVARLLAAVKGTGDLATMPGGLEIKLEGD